MNHNIDEIIKTTPCTKCDAQAGQPCIIRDRETMTRVHLDRNVAARRHYGVTTTTNMQQANLFGLVAR